MRVTTQARHDREHPHRAEHEASRERSASRGVRPKGMAALLRWFLSEWTAEVPDAIHGGELWRGVPGRNESPPKDLLGGSLLGTLAYADPFRRFIENRPGEVDADGFYVRPMRAAVADLAGRDENADSWYWARYLWMLGCNAGDWLAVGERAMVPYPLARLVAEELLQKVWTRWRPGPSVRLENEVAA